MCKCLSCHFKLPCKYINLEQYLFSTDLATESSPLDLFNAFSSIYCSPSFVAPLRGCQESTGQSSWQEVNDPRFSLLKHSPNTTCSFRSILKQALNFQVHETSSGCRLACHLSLYQLVSGTKAGVALQEAMACGRLFTFLVIAVRSLKRPILLV